MGLVITILVHQGINIGDSSAHACCENGYSLQGRVRFDELLEDPSDVHHRIPWNGQSGSVPESSRLC